MRHAEARKDALRHGLIVHVAPCPGPPLIDRSEGFRAHRLQGSEPPLAPLYWRARGVESAER